MQASEIAKLAAALAAGAITEDAISEQFGEGVLSTVVSFAGGGVAAGLVSGLMDVSGASDLIDDIFGGW